MVSYDEDVDTCAAFYELLQSSFPGVFHYNYSHDFSGGYEYFGYANDDCFTIRFPNLCEKDQKWIIYQVTVGRQKTNKL